MIVNYKSLKKDQYKCSISRHFRRLVKCFKIEMGYLSFIFRHAQCCVCGALLVITKCFNKINLVQNTRIMKLIYMYQLECRTK